MPEPEPNPTRDYLLGKLAEDAAQTFEDGFFASESLLRSVDQEQHALIEEYLSGSLPAADAAAFRTRIDRSTTLQNKVEVHRTLLRALERQAHPAAKTPPPLTRPWLWLAAAGLAIAAALGSLLLHHGRPTQPQLAQAVAPTPAPTKPDAVFFLSAGVTRGPNSEPVLQVPATANLIELQVELPVSASTIPQWTLLDLDGKAPIAQLTSQTKQAAGDTYVPIQLPAASLSAGPHTLRLQPTPGGIILTRHFLVHRTGSH